jgi:hypothetical protein
MSLVSWNDFEIHSSNFGVDFENLCRAFFRLAYFSISTHFCQCPNQSGVEIEPVVLDGKKVSFQAKYFTSNVDYRQIESSMMSAYRNYSSGEIEIIYLFCNKDFSLHCGSYSKIENNAREHNITIIPITNLSILDRISTNPVFSPIKETFFGKILINDNWFRRNLQISLEDLYGRYDKDFNIDVPIQTPIEYFLESETAKEKAKIFLFEKKDEIKKLIHVDRDLRNGTIKTLDDIIASLNQNIHNISLFSNTLKKSIDFVEEQLSKISLDNLQEKERISQRDLEHDLRKLDDVLHSLFEGETGFPIGIFKSNSLIIEGEAGTGKSQLIGFEADQQGKTNRIVLLLGQKLINDSDPWTQIKAQLGIDSTLPDFLSHLEGLGIADDRPTTIIIDGINESANHNLWQNYINQMFVLIDSFHYIKFMVTVRSTYKNTIFSPIIEEKIRKGSINLLEHTGFSENPFQAMERYLKKYKIPIEIASYFPFEFSNPLLLRLFCASYTQGCSSTNLTYEAMFNSLIQKEDELIKKQLGILDSHNYVKDVIFLINRTMLESQTNFVMRNDLDFSSHPNSTQESVFQKMLFGQILSSFINNEKNEIIYYRYENFSDFFLAAQLINKGNNLNRLKAYIKDVVRSAKSSRGNMHQIPFGVINSVFCQLPIKKKYRFAFSTLSYLSKKRVDVKQLYKSFIASHSIISGNHIDVRLFGKLLKKANSKITNKSLFEQLFSVLLTNAAKPENPLNALYLNRILSRFSLPDRDFFWTTFINGESDEYSSRTWNTVNWILQGLNRENKKANNLLCVELSWLLSSSNRRIRDKSSRALVRLLIDHIDTSLKIFILFQNVNDPYVFQRLLGCIYGGILGSNKDLLVTESFKSLANCIFKRVFFPSPIYQDILARDYAREIIEYAVHIGVSLDFDIQQVRPPYPAAKMPDFDVEQVRIEYGFDPKNEQLFDTALNRVRNSMVPEGMVSDLGYGYGDFGRYVFQSGLHSFSKVDLERVYLYSLHYIKNVLGFSNKFSEYDKRVNSYDRHNHSIERIGKKYQWIAAHHIWALVCDSHPFQRWYDDSPGQYSGPWDPYVRDFDPTLSLVDTNRVYENDRFNGLPSSRYSSFLPGNEKWINEKKDVADFKKLIEVTDNQGDTWISLFFSETDRSTESYDIDHQEIWREAGAFFCKKENEISYRELLKDKFFWGRWFYRPFSRYELFAREYVWSPGYRNLFPDDFSEVEVPTGVVTKQMVEMPKIPKILFDTGSQEKEIFGEETNTAIDKQESISERERIIIPIGQNGEIESEFIEKDVEEKKVIQVKMAWIEYLWEQEFDYSKDSSSISYLIPFAEIIEHFNLCQKKNGLWYFGDELACADFSLIKGISQEGLYIKRGLLEKFLEEKKYSIFWVGLGEQNDIKKDYFHEYSPSSIFHDISVFLVFEEGRIKEISKLVGNRSDDNAVVEHIAE